MQLQPTKAISILMATRGRPELAFKSLKSMIDLAHNVDQIEFCVAIDNDDIKSMDYFKETVVPWFEEKDHNILVMTFDRLGYANLPKYMETLALQSRGAWFIVWNDDALMESQDWDKEIVSYTGQFKLLAFKDNHNEHPYSIFPIVPREWVVLFGTISPQQAIDAWVSQIAYIVDCFQRIEATVTHDRHDLTGNNDDATYAEREFLEGDPENPKDAFHPDMVALKQQYVEKVVWFLKCIGQDTGRWDKVLRNEVDAMALLHKNDINQHLGVFRKIDGKMVNVGKL